MLFLFNVQLINKYDDDDDEFKMVTKNGNAFSSPPASGESPTT